MSYQTTLELLKALPADKHKAAYERWLSACYMEMDKSQRAFAEEDIEAHIDDIISSALMINQNPDTLKRVVKTFTPLPVFDGAVIIDADAKPRSTIYD